MPLASNPDNIRFNGTGRLYVSATDSANIGMEIGEVDGLSDSISSTEEYIKSNRQAGNLTIATVNSETEGSLKFGARESSVENLELAYSADPADTTSQIAGTIDAVEVTMVSKEYVDLGKTNCFVTKVGHGTVSGGPFVRGETVSSGGVSGEVAWVGSGFVELIGVTGTFASGGTLTGGTSTATATISSIETMVDVVVTDDDTSPTKRYVLGTDYRVDADYGFIMKMPSPGTLAATAFISCSYPAVSKKTLYPMSDVGAVKKLTFVTDANDRGPRMKYIYYRVAMKLDGESQKVGKGEAVLSLSGTLMADTTRPVGRQFMEIQVFE